MTIKRLSITGIDGNGGRTYTVSIDGIGRAIFNSMPGDKQLYCGCQVVNAAMESHKEAARTLAERFVGTLEHTDQTAAYTVAQ